MFRIVRTENTRELYVDERCIFLATIGKGEFGKCPEDVAESNMQKCMKEWNFPVDPEQLELFT